MKSKTKRSIKLATLIGTSLLLTSGVAATLSSCVITWKENYFPNTNQNGTTTSDLLPKNGIEWKKVRNGEQKLYIKDGIVYKDNTETEVIAIVPSSAKLPGVKVVKDSIVLPKTVKKISYYTEITRNSGSTIKTIKGAFEGIDSITNIDLSKCKKLTSIEGPAFKNLPNLTSITLGEKVTSLPNSAFENTPKLKTINGINRITKIGDNAFKGSFSDTNGSDITLDLQSISAIGTSAFENTTKLKTISNINELNTQLTLGASVFKNSGITSLDISNRPLKDGTLLANDQTSENKLPASTFENANSLTSFSLNNNLVTIGENAFNGSKINSANLSSLSNLTTIGENAFANTTSLNNITFPSSISNLQSGVLSGSNVSEINLQNTSITNLSNGVLSELSNLTTVTLPTNIQSIGDRAFENCSNLTTINGLNGNRLSSIGSYAFNGCSSFSTELTFGNNLTSLGERFLNGTNVTSLNLSASTNLTSIGNSAFQNNTKLTTLTLPNTITSIGTSAFEGASELKTVKSFSSLQSLTSIGNSAFKGTKLSSINLSSSNLLTSIGTSAFENTTLLNTINLPTSLTTIGNSAFKNSNLKQVNLSTISNLSTIGDEAFNGLRNATSLQLPNSVVSIGASAFEAIGADINNFNSGNFPTSLTTIGNSAFKNSKISSINNLNSLTNLSTIGDEAFNGTKLTSVDLSGATSLTTIGNGAFKGIVGNISQINTIKLPTSLTTIGNGAFKYASASSIDLHNLTSLTTIGQGAFAENTSLNDLKLPTNNSNLDIQDGAFYKTTSLTSVNLPTNLTQLKRGVFAESGLTSLSLSNNNSITTIGQGALYKTSLNSLDLSQNSSITTIDDFAFSEITSLASAKLPNSLTSLGSNAFAKSNNNAFNTIDLKNTQITRLNDGVFLETKINNITLPKTLTSMSDNVFSNANNANSTRVTNVTWEPTIATTLPNNFYSSGNFSNVTNLTLGGNISSLPSDKPNSLSIVDLSNADKLTNLPNNAFDGTSISSIKLPTNISSIGSFAFANTDISNINTSSSSQNNTLPNTITSIGANAFSNTTSLNNLDLSNTKITSIPESLFEGSQQLVNVKLPTNITSIGNKAFKGADKLENLNKNTRSLSRAVDGLDLSMYNSLSSIGEYAFADTGFTKIENNKLPSSISSIGEGAFSSTIENNPGNLTNIDLSNLTKLTNISNKLFKNNQNLTTVKLPNSISSIGANAFDGTGLSSINLDTLTNLTSIGEYAFANNHSLTSLDLSNTKITNLPANILSNSAGGSGGVPYLSRNFTKAGNPFTLKLPSTITSIDQNAFINFKGQTLDLGNVKISNSVFEPNLEGNTNLTSFSVPHGVTTINTNIVDNATSLTKLTLPGTAINWNQSGDLTTEPVAKTQLSTVEFNVEAVNKNKASSFENINWEQVLKITSIFTDDGQLSWGDNWNQSGVSSVEVFKKAWKDSTNNTNIDLSNTINSASKQINSTTWTYNKNTNTGTTTPFATISATTVSYFKASNGNGYSFGTQQNSSKQITIKINLY